MTPQHPAAQEISEATVRWLLDFGLVRDSDHEAYVRTIGLGGWFPHLLPEGDADKVLLGSQLTAWYTMVDDQLAERYGNRQADLAKVMGHLVHCEQTARLPQARPGDGPLQRALLDVALRLRDAATPEQAVRLQWHAVQYYLGITTEAAYTAQQATPQVADYLRIRQLTTCMPPFYVMSEIARGLSTPLVVVMLPEVQELTALATDLTALANDIIGLPRDLQRGDPWTYARVLARQRHCDHQETVAIMAQEFDQRTRRFVELAGQLREMPLPAVSPYITVLQDLIAGHLAWTSRTPRYTTGGWH
ncbi:hypothetical protein ACFU99_03320 [Streptomyces sp. NPDC057654]|uniref:terpene synthase family protein n=1 Tax=Streptomyces sp. NPDC057654 TaxID=3346196 RepID=UPI0036A1EC78